MKSTIFYSLLTFVAFRDVRGAIHSSREVKQETQGNLLLRGTSTADFEQHGRDLWWDPSSCSNHGQSCGPFSWCCDGYTCNTGFGGDNKCYNSPRLEGEPCGPVNWCRHDLFCGDDYICYGMEDVFESGTLGQCSEASGGQEGQVKVMSYNLFLIECLGNFVTCQEEPDRGQRVQKLANYFRNRDEDVVMFQEVFSHWEDVRDIMTEAGYCHYVTTQKGQTGSGMAIYSKYPMDNFDFIDFFDAFGDSIGGTSPELDNIEAFADKGVMYARILKDGKYFHVTNTHTQSDSYGDEFQIRLGQYDVIKHIIDRQNIIAEELVLMGGDFNEDKACSQGLGPGCSDRPDLAMCQVDENGEGTYYKALKETIKGDIPQISGIAPGVGPYSHDTSENPFLANLWVDETCNTWDLLLDYIFYSTDHKQPASGSFCEILAPKDSNDGSDLSDHYPITCTYTGL